MDRQTETEAAFRKRWKLAPDDPLPTTLPKMVLGGPTGGMSVDGRTEQEDAPSHRVTLHEAVVDDAGKGSSQCRLIAPAGTYGVAAGQVARFDPATAHGLSRAIEQLNRENIRPTITSGYRSPDYQASLRRRKGDPTTVTPAKVSRHEVGSAVDFGPNSNAGQGEAIRKAMTAAGFVWGGRFKRPDPMHYQLGGPPLDQDYIEACARAAAGK